MTRDRYLSDAELSRFMEQVRTRRHKNQPRDHALFSLLATTGIRPSEAMGLTVADCSLEPQEPLIRLHRARGKAKVDPTNELVLPGPVADLLRVAVAGLSPTARPFGFTKRQAARLFHYYSRKAELPAHFRIYSLRHTAGRRLWRSTRDLRLIQAIMGHRRLLPAMAYIHVTDAAMRAAMSLQPLEA